MAGIHSDTVSLRAILKDEVIELPAGRADDLPPGQQESDSSMALDPFADQVMALFEQAPTRREIMVEGGNFMRNAEAEGRTGETPVDGI